MSREYFGSWGSDLNEIEFAGALAALGVLCSSSLSKQPHVRELPDIPSYIDNLLATYNADPSAPLHWSPFLLLNELNDESIAPLAKGLSDAWNVFVKSGVKSIRLELDPPKEYHPILTWLYKLFDRHALGVCGLYFLHKDNIEPSRLHVPLHLGCIDTDTKNLLNDLLNSEIDNNLVKVTILSKESPECDFLTTSLLSLDTLAYKPSLTLQAACLIVFQAVGMPTRVEDFLIDFNRASTRSSGVCIVPFSVDNSGDWLTRLVRLLVRNVPLDRAVRESSLEGQPCYLFATRKLIISSSLSQIKKKQYAVMKSGDTSIGKKTIKPLRWRIASRNLNQPIIKKIDLSGLGTFEGEVDNLSDSHSITLTKPPLKDYESRFVQAQLFKLTDDGVVQPSKRALVAEQRYIATIRIGPNDSQWLTPDEKSAFPDHLLPDEDQVPLKVFFSEPRHSPDVQLATIVLPHQGASTECNFSFEVKRDLCFFEGRIIVAYQNRILQTALLKGEVVENAAAAGIPPIIEAEVVIRQNLTGIYNRTSFDMALVVNHSSDGLPRLTKLSDDHASILDIENIQSSIRIIQEALETATRDDVTVKKSSADDGFDSPEMLDLLNLLAIHGRYLYCAIIKDEIDAGWLKRNPDRIQVVSAKAESYLPLEFLYEKPVPKENAQMCPLSKQALASGLCQPCLIPTESDDSQYICPLGFWGLNKIIERHIHDPSYKNMLGFCDYALQAEPMQNRTILQPLRTYLYAASQRVNAITPGLTEIFVHSLDESTSHRGAVVSTWDNWVKEVADKKPTILMLMPHTLEDKKVHAPAMEIGESEKLISARITSRYVRASSGDQPPIVMLLGCETMVPYEKYMGFIPPFRQNGAALVLATLTTVLGRHVVPIAQKILVELKAKLAAADTPVSIGDILLHVRRKALLDGFPTVLSLVAYGDADWKLIQEESNVPD